MKRRTSRFKKIALFVLPVSAIWLLWQLIAPPAPAATGNMLANPGFESEKAELPEGWSFSEQSRQFGQITVTTKAASGQRALLLRPNRSNPDDWRALNVAQGFRAGTVAGKNISLKASLAATGGSTAVFGAWVVDARGAIIATEQVTSTNAQYETKNTTLDVPQSSSAVMLIIQCQVVGTTGEAYFDDVSAEITDGEAKAGVAAPSGQLSADIVIDAASVIREVPRTVYGQNISWIWGGTMLYDFRTNKLSDELIQLTRDLNPSLLRFPGGSFADFYHWRDGVGPQDQRKTTPHQPSDASSKHMFGTDEALTFAERTGSRLLVTVNAHSGTPEEAADWVRYVNGQSATRRVDHWEIGNEFYIKNEHPANAAIPPEEYARRFLAFARQMRGADRGIKLLGIGGENFGRYASNNFPEWNRKVLTTAGSEMDYLAVHNAYFPAVFTQPSASNVRRVYSAMLAAPLLIRQNLDTLAEQIKKYAPGRPIKIAVTEWGPIFDVDPKSRWVDHVKTLGSALFVASTMKVFVEHPSVDIANAFKLNDVGFMGWIGIRHEDHLTRQPRGQEYLPTAPYLAFQLFSRHFGERVVTTSTVAPTYDSEAVGMTDAVSKVPYLEAVSSLSGDGRTLYVIVINKHFDQHIEGRFALRSFRPSGSAVVRVLQGTGIDAHTGTRLPKGTQWARQIEDQSNPRFARGGPEEVKVTTSSITASEELTYKFLPHSVTAFEIRGQRP